MAIVSDVEIRLRADIARLQQDMTAVRRTVDQGMQGVTRAANLAKAALGGIVAGLSIGAFLKEVVTAQREFDKLNASLITATGSTANAAQAFSALEKFAATTPYSVAEATEAFIKLRNLGLEPSEKALRSYGNTASSQGKSLSQFIEAVADAATSEFERLKEFGIKAKQNGDLVSFTFQGVTKTIGNNSKDIEKYLQRIGEVEFAGAMERRANTLDGAISNLADSWDGFLLKVASNGIGEAAMSGVLALSGALSDLGAILDVVGGSARKEGEAVKESSAIHTVLTTAFEAIAVLGVNASYILVQLGKDIGAFSASFVAFLKGDFKASAQIVEMRKKDAEEARVAVDAKSAAILGASKKNIAAQEAEAASVNASSKDQLAQYGLVLTAEQERDKALQDSLELRNKLNGVNSQTAGDLKKLKAAYDTGAIGLAEYNKYVAQINKETTLSSTAYKDQVKALDLSTAAIKRRADIQGLLNQREQEHIGFLLRTGQINEEESINKIADAQIKDINNQIAAQVSLAAVARKRIDNQKEVADIEGGIATLRVKIDNAQAKREDDLFELAQKYRKQGIENAADLIEAAQAESKTHSDRTRDMQEEIEALGLTSKEVANLTATRLRDQAVALDRKAEIAIIEEVADAYRKQAEELRKQADLVVSKEQIQSYQKFWSDVEQTAHDTFVSIADGGKGAFQRLKDSAKNIFFEWLYQMTLKKWVINIGASVDGASAVAGLAGGSSSLQGMNSVGSIYSALTGGMSIGGGVGTGFIGSLAGGLNGAGVGSGLTSSLGLSIGNTIAETLGPTISSALSTGISGLATALPWVGGAVAVYTLAKAAFGRGPKQYADNSTLSGMIGSAGFSGTVDTAYTQKGGWFRSDKNGVDKKAVEAMQASGLSAAYDAIKTSSTSYAQVLGLNADSIVKRTQTVSIALGKDQAANEKAIADFFVGVGDSIAAELLPAISMFQHESESASTTLQRLAVDFQAVDQILALMGTDSAAAFKSVGSASIEARERLIALAGGLDALASQTQYFNENFLTQAEQIALVQRPLTQQLEALGYAGLTTTDQFKQAVQGLVQSGALATQDGARTYATLLAIAPNFKKVADYLKEASDAADEASEKAREAARQALENNEAALRTFLDNSLSALSRAVDSQKDKVTKAYQSAMEAIEGGIDRVNETISRTRDLSSALYGAMQGIATPQQAIASRAAAQAQITASLAIARASGVLPSLDDLKDALSAVTVDASDQFTTLAEYQRSVARTNAELEQLGGLTDGQLDNATRQLKVLQDQKALTQLAYEAETQRLDGILAAAQAEVDAINGVDNSVVSVAVGLAGVRLAIEALRTGATTSNPTGTGLSVNDLYRTVLGRNAEQAGLDYWKKVFGDVIDSNEYQEFIKAAQPELNMQKSNAIPMVDSPVQYGRTTSTYASSSGGGMDRMEQSMTQMANKITQLADEFHNVSAGGNSLAVDPV